jgi:hypothetical protein
MHFCQWVSYTTIKHFIILGVTLFFIMSGKSSWVHSRTQGFVPTCYRWADVLRLLYQLPLSCDRWCLGPWAMVIPYVSFNAFVGDDHQLALYFELRVSVCGFELFASATFYLKSVCNSYVWTLMHLWCELLCNMWWWLLNLLWSWLVCELVWNPSWFHGLPSYTGLSLLNRLLWRVICLLNFVWLVGSVTHFAFVIMHYWFLISNPVVLV